MFFGHFFKNKAIFENEKIFQIFHRNLVWDEPQWFLDPMVFSIVSQWIDKVNFVVTYKMRTFSDILADRLHTVYSLLTVTDHIGRKKPKVSAQNFIFE